MKHYSFPCQKSKNITVQGRWGKKSQLHIVQLHVASALSQVQQMVCEKMLSQCVCYQENLCEMLLSLSFTASLSFCILFTLLLMLLSVGSDVAQEQLIVLHNLQAYHLLLGCGHTEQNAIFKTQTIKEIR